MANIIYGMLNVARTALITQQKALDVMADEMFEARLRQTDVRWYASEEQEDVLELNPKGKYALAIDPLDGSSNIEVNVSIGTIFSIFEALDDPKESFLRTAREQVAGALQSASLPHSPASSLQKPNCSGGRTRWLQSVSPVAASSAVKARW